MGKDLAQAQQDLTKLHSKEDAVIWKHKLVTDLKQKTLEDE